MARDVKAGVDEFAGQVEQLLDDNLVSMLLYGAAVRGQGGEAPTILIVVKDPGPRALRPVNELITKWVKKGNPPPLIFGERELRASTDVFPIEIEEMREAHVLLKGGNPLEGLPTTREDLRHELEREVRGKLLQLRAEFAAAAADGKALSALVAESANTFFILFRAVLRLVGRTPPRDVMQLVRDIGPVAAIDEDAFEWVLDRLAGKKTAALKAHDSTGYRYMEQIERLASFIDGFDTTLPAGAPGTGE